MDAGEVLEGSLTEAGGVSVERRHSFPETTVGAVAFGKAGELLVAVRDELVVMDPDGSRRSVARTVPAGVASRNNDGATDPAGRFVVGTMVLDRNRHGQEVLVRLELDGSVTTIDDDLGLSNGIAWSADGSLMYSADTLAQVVWVRDYDAATGATGPRREHLRLASGHPDGICVDATDHLWVAVWGGGEVRRFAPDGTVVDRVKVPVPNPT
nr:SMP-30/gluconolactonase/LRE family protein [Micromonospora sp. DSM 115978]